MSLRPDGSYRCDRCGSDVGNGAVTEAAVVADLELVDDEDVAARPRTLHFCRAPRKKAPHGCAGHILGPRALADYLASKETHA